MRGVPASDDPLLAADRDLLHDAIQEAGALTLRYFRADPNSWHKAPGQIVTEADVAADDLLRQTLRGARPAYGWLSEEREDDGSRFAAERVWVVDPIDGTQAFVEGVPEYSVSVGLLIAGCPALGMVHNPATDELFEARRGRGARLNGEPVRASGRATLAGARLLSSRGEIHRRSWRELFPEARVTTVGSLAYKLALVACGRFDGYVSLRRTYDWDLAAGALLIEEAGGRITLADGTELRFNDPEPRHAGLAAATAPIHGDLVARLRTRLG